MDQRVPSPVINKGCFHYCYKLPWIKVGPKYGTQVPDCRNGQGVHFNKQFSFATQIARKYYFYTDYNKFINMSIHEL